MQVYRATHNLAWAEPVILSSGKLCVPVCVYMLLYLFFLFFFYFNAFQAVSYCTVLKLQEIPTLFTQVIQHQEWFQFCVWHFRMSWLFIQNQKAVS